MGDLVEMAGLLHNSVLYHYATSQIWSKLPVPQRFWMRSSERSNCMDFEESHFWGRWQGYSAYDV
jgi:hypothetical protein